MPSAAARLTARWFMPMALGLLVLAMYATSLSHSTMARDVQVVLTPGAQGQVLGSFRPITWVTFQLDAQVLAMDVRLMRGGNALMLAVLGVAIAYWIAGYTSQRALAWCGAALFVVHPANVQAVLDLAGRADLLAMLGIAGFAGLQRRALTTGQWSRRRAIAAVLLATMAVGARETGLVLLLVAVVQCWLAARMHLPRPGDLTPPNPMYRSTIALLAGPIIALIIARSVLVGWSPPLADAMPADDLTGNPLASLSIVQRVPSALAIAWFYFQQIFWPNPGYSHTPIALPTWRDAEVWLGVAVVLFSLVSLGGALQRARWSAVGWTLALGHYLLISNLFFPLESYASNLFMQPIIAAAVLVAMAWSARRTILSARSAAIIVIPTIVLLPPMCYKSLAVAVRWESEALLTFMDHHEQPGNPVAMYNYASSLLASGHIRRAEDLLDQVLYLRPDSVQALQKRAEACMVRGDLQGAADRYERIIDLRPLNVEARCGLANLSLAAGDLTEAAEHVAITRRVAPDDVRVMFLDARLHLAHGRTGQAVAMLEAIIQRHPTHIAAGELLEQAR